VILNKPALLSLSVTAEFHPVTLAVFVTDAPAKSVPMIFLLSKLEVSPIFRLFQKDCNSAQSLMRSHEHYKA
jgi:hypothetical protein